MSGNTVPIHGNYHGYYNKRPSTNDLRLALTPPSLFEGRRVLDVGCNEGLVTCEIAQTRGAVRVVGVDIDGTLVRAAWKHRRSVWSQQGPSQKHHHDGNEDANGEMPSDSRKRRRVSQVDARPDSEYATPSSDGMAGYFPASCEHMFGPLPIPDAATHGEGETRGFPHNVSFRTADWVHNKVPEDAEGFDVVVAFSVSKWIHLNGGDEGLLTFFRRVHEVLRPGGMFVLEPQEWNTYAKAKRMDPTLKENAKRLQLRPDDFERVLGEVGFGPAEHLGSTGEGGFRRQIDLYVKREV